MKTASPSHTLLISPGHTPLLSGPKERKRVAVVAPRCFKLFAMIVAAAALLFAAAAPVVADGNGKGGASAAKKFDKPDEEKPKQNKNQRKPSDKVQGDYVIRIAGYYTGSGTGNASSDGVTITATVKDPAGKQYAFQSTQLSVTDDRFSGTGTLDGAEAQIDGRLDGQDAKGKGGGLKGKEVLKKGRMTFTFSVNGRRARGAGVQGQQGGS